MNDRQSDPYAHDDEFGEEVASISSSTSPKKDMPLPHFEQPSAPPVVTAYPVVEQPMAHSLPYSMPPPQQQQPVHYSHYQEPSPIFDSGRHGNGGYQNMDPTGEVDHCGHCLCLILFGPLWVPIWIGSCLCQCCVTPCCGVRLSGVPGITET